MTVNAHDVSIGHLELSFQRIDDEGLGSAEIDLMAPDQRSLAGVALNCLTVGDLTAVEALQDRHFRFGRESGQEESNIHESVFFLAKGDTLEIEHIDVSFGVINAGVIEIDIRARCFDHHGTTNIDVTLNGGAKIVRK